MLKHKETFRETHLKFEEKENAKNYDCVQKTVEVVWDVFCDNDILFGDRRL